MNRLTSTVFIRAACWIGLVALAFMAWAIFVPRTVPVLASMSVGQGLGALAFACYIGAILFEVKKHEDTERRPPTTRTTSPAKAENSD